MNLPAGARDNLIAQARSLGETEPPPGLSTSMTEAIDMLIKLAFVDSFRVLMVASAVLVLISLGILLTTGDSMDAYEEPTV